MGVDERHVLLLGVYPVRSNVVLEMSEVVVWVVVVVWTVVLFGSTIVVVQSLGDVVSSLIWRVLATSGLGTGEIGSSGCAWPVCVLRLDGWNTFLEIVKLFNYNIYNRDIYKKDFSWF